MGTITYTNAAGTTVTVDVPVNSTNGNETGEFIQAVLDDVATRATAGDPQTITLSEGTFEVGKGTNSNGALEVGSNIVFQGTDLAGTSGLDTVIKLKDGATGDVTGIVRTDSGLTSTTNVTVKNLVIDGNRASNAAVDVDGFYCGPQPGTQVNHDSNITIENVTVQNCSRYGFDPHEQTKNLTITNSTATNNKDGFVIDYCSNVTLTNCVATGNDRYGFNVTTGSYDVQLIGCTATGNDQAGLSIDSGDNENRVLTDDITVTGGTFSNNGTGTSTGAGITVRQATNITISGATLADNVDTGIHLRGVKNVTIDGNTLTGNGTTSDGQVKIGGYLQDYDTGDTLDDRFLKSDLIAITNNAMTADASSGSYYGVRYEPDTVSIGGVPTSSGQAAIATYLTNSGNTFNVAGKIAEAASSPVAQPHTYTYVITRGADTIYGGLGGNVIAADEGNDVVYGEDGANGSTGPSDHLMGNDGNDTLHGEGGDDILQGGHGDDKFIGGAGNDLIYGGFKLASGTGALTETAYQLGRDTVDWSAATAAIVFTLNATGGGATANVAGIGVDTITYIENLIGGGAGDTLTGNGLNNVLNGGAGTDTLDGAGGIDTVDWTGTAATVLFTLGAAGVQTRATIGGVLSDYVLNFEYITGGSAADTLTGNAAANVVKGGDGNDTLRDGAGADSLLGELGNDILRLDLDATTETLIDGGAGASDVLDLFNATAATTVTFDAVIAGKGTVTAGGFGSETFFNFEGIYGSATAADTVNGGAAGETFSLRGGDDVVNGGGGNDSISGSTGADTMTGGSGNDVFGFQAVTDSGTAAATRDKIADFKASSATDRIGVSVIDAMAGTGGDQAFTYIGAAAFSAEGQARAVQSGASTIVEFNTTGTTTAEFTIELQTFTATTLVSGDFIL